MNDDAELLRRYAEQHDETAFAELVRRHLSLVYYTALRRVEGDAQCAQDIAQEVFTELARRALSLVRYPVLGGWLYARSRHVGLNAMRSLRRRQVREREAHTMIESAFESGQPADWERLRPVIDRALHTLNETDRNAICLRFFEGKPLAEVGARFGLSEDAARKRIERSMEKLRRSLKRLGVTSGMVALELAIAGQAGAAVPTGLAESVAAGSLAAAGIPLGGLAAAVQFMSTTKVVVGAAIAAGIMIAGVSVHEQKMIRKAEAVLAREESDTAAALRQLRELKRQTDFATQRLAALQGAESGSRTGADSSAVANAKAVRGRGTKPVFPNNWPLSAVSRELIQDPLVRKTFAAYLDSMLNAGYAPLYKSLGLSSVQIAALENLKAEQNQNVGPAVLTLRPDDVPKSQVRQQMQDLLGESGYEEYRQFDQTVSGGQLVSRSLAGNLYDTDYPLTSAQADQLTHIITTSSSQSYTYPANINWNTAMAGAETVLSPQQYSVLQNIVNLMGAYPTWETNGIRGIDPGSFGNGPTPPPPPR